MPDLSSHAGDSLARATIPLDNGLLRPWSHDAGWQNAAVAHWQSLVDAGLIGANPPTPPDIVSQRAANDALFRGFARDRHRAARLGSPRK